MEILGITGGIGSGKSYVSHLLELRGIPVYDTDREAKRLTESLPVIHQELEALLGEDVFAEGRLNKPLLAAYLFDNHENAARVNAIIHPRVLNDFKEWAWRQERQGKDIVAMESAILFESGFYRVTDHVLVVEAPLEVRIARVMARDHAERVDVMQRIAAQMDDKERVGRADFVICNDGRTIPESQLERILQLIGSKKR